MSIASNMRKPIAFLYTIIFPIIFFYISTTSADSYYVDVANGDDRNSGRSSGAAFKTIGKAEATMGAGDSCLVMPGTYSERVFVSKSGSSIAPRVFLALGKAVTQGFTIEADFVHVIGFEVRNTPDHYKDGVGIFVKGRFCVIRNNNIHDVSRSGIRLDAESPDDPATGHCTVSGNMITRAGLAGIYVRGQNHLIEKNDISHTLQHPPNRQKPPGGPDADGIRFFGKGHRFVGNFIHDITFTDIENIDPHKDGLQTWGPAENITFERNIINMPENTDQGFMIEALDGAIKNLVFKNNIFMMNAESYAPAVNIHRKTGQYAIERIIFANNVCIGLAQTRFFVRLIGCRDVRVLNNIFYTVGKPSSYVQPYWYIEASADVQVGSNSFYTSDGNYPNNPPWPNDVWRVDPGFVDVASKDFHLQETSLLIDAGLAVQEVADDFDGVSRPQGKAVDIGIFEFTDDKPPAPPRGVRAFIKRGN